MDTQTPSVHLDFETFSLAGSTFSLKTGRFVSAAHKERTLKKGIGLVGAYAYAAHPSADILVACYRFEGGEVRRWAPGALGPPTDLLEHVSRGGSVSAMNSFFEWCIWNLVAVRRYGWPPLLLEQTRDTAANARAWSLPGSLKNASAALFGKTEKDTGGSRIMLKFSQGRSPTKNDWRLRYERAQPKTAKEADEWRRLDEYCVQDVRAEENISENVPPLSFREFQVWQLDQKINARGIQVDVETVESCLKIVKEGKRRAGVRLAQLTDGAVTEVSQATALLRWVNECAPQRHLNSLEPAVVSEYLENCKSDIIRQVLQIRRDYGGNATAKLVAMKYMSAPDGRVRGAYQYCGAQRTRRWAGRGVQTQNMPNDGPNFLKCDSCEKFVSPDAKMFSAVKPRPTFLNNPCLCGRGHFVPYEWGIEGVETALIPLQTASYDNVEYYLGNPLKVVSGCLRSLLIAAPGHELISSDYSAIEAVVMACLAGEQWIIDVFFGDGKLYEHTGAQITGVSVGEILEHKKSQGSHHAARKLGKVASLASQYQGARGAWLKFGAGRFLSDEEIDEGVRKWRKAAPNIVRFWSAVENAAMSAVTYPGVKYPVGQSGVFFRRKGRALYCVLANGEWLTYVDPRIIYRKKLSAEGWRIFEAVEAYRKNSTPANWLEVEHQTQTAAPLLRELSRVEVLTEIISDADIRNMIAKYYFVNAPTLTYYGEGLNRKWTRIDTYGGKLAENIVQATARFILSEALLRLEGAGYPIVMHTHDEAAAEVPTGFGSIEEFEKIMSVMPGWARLPDGRSWPIRAAGGWRGQRYRK